MSDPETPKAVTVYGLAQARAAVAAAARAGRPLILLSGPAAAASIGPAWFRALVAQAADGHPGTGVTGVLDCAGFAGHALAALRAGVGTIVYAGPAQARIEAIAARYGADVRRARPAALDARAAGTGVRLDRALAAWLAVGDPEA